MKRYAYHSPTGEIIVLSELQDGDSPPALGIGTPIEVGADVDAATHKIVSGAVVAYTTEGATRRSLRPAEWFIWDAPTEQWIDPRTLADLKAAKNDAINRARAAANSSHFTFQGKQIAVDPLSRSDIDATHGAVLMLQALPPGWPGGWKAMDNTMVPIADLNTWGAFYAAMVAQGTANFNHAQTLKAQLAAASTPAEVEAVPSW